MCKNSTSSSVMKHSCWRSQSFYSSYVFFSHSSWAFLLSSTNNIWGDFHEKVNDNHKLSFETLWSHRGCFFYGTFWEEREKKTMQFLLSERPSTAVSVPQVIAGREYAHDPISFFCLKHQMETIIWGLTPAEVWLPELLSIWTWGHWSLHRMRSV